MDEEAKRIKREIFGKHKEVIQEQPEASGEVNPELAKLFPPERLKRIMTKEARKYKAALERKWKKWMEAVSR